MDAEDDDPISVSTSASIVLCVKEDVSLSCCSCLLLVVLCQSLLPLLDAALFVVFLSSLSSSLVWVGGGRCAMCCVLFVFGLRLSVRGEVCFVSFCLCVLCLCSFAIVFLFSFFPSRAERTPTTNTDQISVQILIEAPTPSRSFLLDQKKTINAHQTTEKILIKRVKRIERGKGNERIQSS